MYGWMVGLLSRIFFRVWKEKVCSLTFELEKSSGLFLGYCIYSRLFTNFVFLGTAGNIIRMTNSAHGGNVGGMPPKKKEKKHPSRKVKVSHLL